MDVRCTQLALQLGILAKASVRCRPLWSGGEVHLWGAEPLSDQQPDTSNVLCLRNNSILNMTARGRGSVRIKMWRH